MDISRNKVLAISGGALVMVALAWGVYSMVSGSSQAPRKAPKISLVPSTPPPPPPPPKEEKKPEPPKDQKEPPPQQMEQPKAAPPAPPSQDLKMDGPAGDGPSAFSAGKITNEDLSKIGSGGAPVAAAAGLFNPFTNYSNLLKGEVQRFLNRNREVRRRSYSIEVQLWVGRDGVVTRQEVVKSTGDEEFDQLLHQTLAAIPAFTQAPPERMPQPIRLRITTGRS